MNKKYTIVILGMLLIGLVSASGVIENFKLDYSELNLVGGETRELGFSFDFNERVENSPDSSLVLRFNVTSLDAAYPVWKGDFLLSGGIVDYTSILPSIFPDNQYPLKCVEDLFAPKTERGILYEEEILQNGTFYCYDPNDYLDMLKLNRKDIGFLELTPHQNIYPGEYNFTIELMEVERDFEPPMIDFLTDEKIYGPNDSVKIKFNVSDMYNIYEVKYQISNNLLEEYYNSGWIEATYNSTSEFYEDEFDFVENDLNMSGDYFIWAWACDMLGNCREM